jgi:hypothetical protein
MLVSNKHQLSIVKIAIDPFHYIPKLATVLKPRNKSLSLCSILVKPLNQTDSHSMTVAIRRPHGHPRHVRVSNEIELLTAFDYGTET